MEEEEGEVNRSALSFLFTLSSFRSFNSPLSWRRSERKLTESKDGQSINRSNSRERDQRPHLRLHIIMALVVRVHFLKAPARNVVVKEPREKKMRAIKDEVFTSLSRQFKGEPSDYEAFLHHPRRVLAGVVGDDPAEDTTASTRDESSPRPPASSAVEMCWLRDDEYLPLPDGVRPKVPPPRRSNHQPCTYLG